MCRQPKYVFLTHTHSDHSVDVAYMSKKEGMTLFCPEVLLSTALNAPLMTCDLIAMEWVVCVVPRRAVSCVASDQEVSGVVEEYIKASSQLNWGQPIPEGHGFMAGSLQPVKPGDTYLIKNGLYQVTVLRCFHSVRPHTRTHRTHRTH